MEDEIKIEDITICHGCLSYDRSLNSLDESYELFTWLTSGARSMGYNANDTKFCWECLGKLKKFRLFQKQLVQAQNALMQILYDLGTPPTLSNLTSKTISIIDNKQNNEILVETIPTIDNIEKVIKKENLTDDKDQHKEFKINDDTDDVKNDDFNSDDVKNDFNNGDVQDDDFVDDYHLSEPEPEIEIKAEDKRAKRNKQKAESFKRYQDCHRKLFKENSREITETKDLGDVNSYFSMLNFNEMEMEQHILVKERIFTDLKKYKYCCKECNIGYRSLRDFQRHNDLNHAKTKTHKCTACKKVLPSLEELSEHWREHSVVAKCKLCNKLMKTHGMRQHLNLSHVDRYACNSCNMTFQSLKQFGIHFKNAHMNYTCDHCNMTYRCKIKMAKHIKMSHIPVHCKDCNRTLSNEMRYKSHCTVVHPERVNKDVSPELRFCVECDKQFPSAASYGKHLQDSVRHAGKRPKKATCPECGKVFHKITNMKNHFNLYHLKKTNNYCQLCDKYYARASGLRKHRDRVHLKIKLPRTVMCDLCGRYFGTKRIMLNHRATHTGERAYSCLYCSATFIQKYAMQSHMKTQHKHFS